MPDASKNAGGGIAGRRVPTADSGLLVLLEIIVHETEYEGGLEIEVGQRQHFSEISPVRRCYSRGRECTFPTAASPSRTSLTLLLGLVAAAVVSAMLCAFPSAYA